MNVCERVGIELVSVDCGTLNAFPVKRERVDRATCFPLKGMPISVRNNLIDNNRFSTYRNERRIIN